MIILELHLKLNAKQKYGEGLKILSFKQILQRLPIALAQVKAGNASKANYIFFLSRKRKY